ncbi:MAG: hypothetical protein JETT_2351 [Candidatus Jettenia ecosi]|uniref:DUF4231 domain-containing protein n=1 Tax=Candidatus Jettenia ecosi TaxID=2494326 RepID=A0A533Q9M6_9BACT|nr:MAG: hypothetical protein JETT_2351 [Candidatus Jettenia ecosi]
MLRQNYRNFLAQDMNAIIETLPLSDLQKHFLRSRWLNHVLRMEGKANEAHSRYYILRLITIVGGVIIPTLVSLNIIGAAASPVRWGTLGLGLLVAVSIAIEEFFHFGECWRHYRKAVEWLKIEGWQFFQLSGPYQNYLDHIDAYPVFANRVESIIQRDVEVYITEIVQEKKEENLNNSITTNKINKLDIAIQKRIES